ncbi:MULTISPECIES: DUF6328 family protein [unclassified Streptomyces]|uniref:DUF6328 family protein n=1 Tax=unclassified Streptomyces TaxID=2593676 RepID=UPI003440F317
MTQGTSGRGSSGGSAAPGRNETPEQRADRQWGELLQELRVVQTGVQILFGFLLTVVFQQRFGELSDSNRTLYIVTVTLGAAATGALVGPVSLHRIMAGHRLKPETVVWASRFTVVGLILLVCTMAAALLLVLRVAGGDSVAIPVVAGLVVWFGLAWFVLPAAARYFAIPPEDSG